MHLIGGEVNFDVWGGCMESTDESSGHEIHISISSVKMGPVKSTNVTKEEQIV